MKIAVGTEDGIHENPAANGYRTRLADVIGRSEEQARLRLKTCTRSTTKNLSN